MVIKSVKGKELAGNHWQTVHSAPDLPKDGEMSRVDLFVEQMRGAIKETVLQMAEELSVEAGYAAGFKGEVYSALMMHIRDKFLDGVSLGLAERADLGFAWKMLPQMRTKISGVPGLIAGIIEYGNQ